MTNRIKKGLFLLIITTILYSVNTIPLYLNNNHFINTTYAHENTINPPLDENNTEKANDNQSIEELSEPETTLLQDFLHLIGVIWFIITIIAGLYFLFTFNIILLIIDIIQFFIFAYVIDSIDQWSYSPEQKAYYAAKKEKEKENKQEKEQEKEKKEQTVKNNNTPIKKEETKIKNIGGVIPVKQISFGGIYANTKMETFFKSYGETQNIQKLGYANTGGNLGENIYYYDGLNVESRPIYYKNNEGKLSSYDVIRKASINQESNLSTPVGITPGMPYTIIEEKYGTPFKKFEHPKQGEENNLIPSGYIYIGVDHISKINGNEIVAFDSMLFRIAEDGTISEIEIERHLEDYNDVSEIVDKSKKL